MDDELDIIVTGLELDQRQVEAGLVRVFGIEPQQARRLLRELPTTAKRAAPRALAERYVAALRSIGARVEARPARLALHVTRPPVAGSSLPPPQPSAVARARESQRVQHETERAIKRFRAAEGLDPEPEDPDIDLFNPDIPKAPALPHDLARMPNSALPRFSDRPGWMLTDPLADGDETTRAHNDAQNPPPASLAPQAVAIGGAAPALRGGAAAISGFAPALRSNASVPPHRDSALESVPARAVGLAHKATASIRPGLSSLRDIPNTQRTRVRVRLRVLLPVFAVAVVVAGAVLYWTGFFDRGVRRHEQAWRAQGIDAGEAADARRWLEAPDHEVRAMGKLELRDLVERLTRTGARGVYVIQLEPTAAGQRAGALLVELPEGDDARRTLFAQLAKVPGQKPGTQADHGQPYQTLSLR
jgi:hypothetical protein